MVLEDLTTLRDLSIGAVGMVVFYKFASMVVNNATQQMTQLHNNFLAAYKENTKALQELVTEFKEHVREKDHAIELLEKRHDELKKELEDKYDYLRKLS